MIDIEFLLECRRNAYISCTMQFIEKNNVVGYFGEHIPLEIFYGYNLFPVPLEDVDADVFAFSSDDIKNDKTLCDCIRSTLTYLETDKCPILHSCKAFVFAPVCKKFFSAFSNLTKKDCVVLPNEYSEWEAYLKKLLASFSDTAYDSASAYNAKKKLDYISSTISKIECKTKITTEELFLLQYYTPYILELDERVQYFKDLEQQLVFSDYDFKRPHFSLPCPRGYFHDAVSYMPSQAKVSWGDSSGDFADSHCFISAPINVHYSSSNKI